MAFDVGFDFRSTAVYVTDPAYGVPALGEAYPHTYTNSNGDSINAGFTDTSYLEKGNINNALDVRLAGQNYTYVPHTTSLQIDLSSGSAPGTGDYAIDCALGHSAGTYTISFQVKDSSTVLIDNAAGISNGGAGRYIDASLAVVAATTTWTGTPVTKTFATTTALLALRPTGVGDYSFVQHFRLTKQEVPTAYVLVCTPRPTPT